MKKMPRIAVLVLFVCSLFLPSISQANQNQLSKSQLKDIEKHWAKQEILKMKDKSIIGGYPDGSFKPNQFVTREEAAKILTVAFRVPLGKLDSQSFSDVDQKRWSYVPVELIKPYFYSTQNNRQFRPTEQATRAEIISAMVRILDNHIPAVKNSKVLDREFTDVEKIPEVIRPEIIRAFELGLISGYEDKTIKGEAGVKRGELAALINRAFEKVGEVGAKGPKLSVSHLKETNEETLIISGVTHPQADLTINKEPIDLDNNGRFKALLQLKAGINRIKVVSVDRNGYKTEYNGQVIYSNSGPYIQVSIPQITDQEFLQINGKTISTAKVTINGQTVSVNHLTGEFRNNLKLKKGFNKYKIVAVNSNGKETVQEGEIEYLPPTKYQITIPKSSLTKNVPISGTVPKNTIVLLNGTKLNVNPAGGFTTYLSLNNGLNSVVLRLIYPSGEIEIVKGEVLYADNKPQLWIQPIPAETNDTDLVIKGLLTGAVSVTINGADVTLNEGRFEHTLTLVGGENQIEIVGVNGQNVTVKESYMIICVIDAVIIDVLDPSQEETTENQTETQEPVNEQTTENQTETQQPVDEQTTVQ